MCMSALSAFAFCAACLARCSSCLASLIDCLNSFAVLVFASLLTRSLSERIIAMRSSSCPNMRNFCSSEMLSMLILSRAFPRCAIVMLKCEVRIVFALFFCC